MYLDRKRFYERIEHERNSKVIAYVTGDRPGLEAQIGADTPDIFLEHLDAIGKVDKISLVLYAVAIHWLHGISSIFLESFVMN